MLIVVVISQWVTNFTNFICCVGREKNRILVWRLGGRPGPFTIVFPEPTWDLDQRDSWCLDWPGAMGPAWALGASRRQLENSLRKWPCGDTAGLWDSWWLRPPGSPRSQGHFCVPVGTGEGGLREGGFSVVSPGFSSVSFWEWTRLNACLCVIALIHCFQFLILNIWILNNSGKWTSSKERDCQNRLKKVETLENLLLQDTIYRVEAPEPLDLESGGCEFRSCFSSSGLGQVLLLL